jgi:septum formation protein
MKLILASESPGRKQVLIDEGFVFDVVPSNFDEENLRHLSPLEMTLALSLGKARSVAALHPDATIIGADTVAVFENEIMGKPHTEENSHRMLSKLSKNVHSMLTGLTVIHGGKEINRSVETKIWFREIPMEEIIEYAKTGEALKKAGGYAYQLNGHKFVEKTEGSVSNIIGMPVEELRMILNELES